MKATRTVPASRTTKTSPTWAARFRRVRMQACLSLAEDVEASALLSEPQVTEFREEALNAMWHSLGNALQQFGLIEDIHGERYGTHLFGFEFDQATFDRVRELRGQMFDAILAGIVVQGSRNSRATDWLRAASAASDDTLQRCIADAMNAARGAA